MDLLLTSANTLSVENPHKNTTKNSSNQLPSINNYLLSSTISTNHRAHIHSRHRKSKSLRHSYNTQPFFNSTFNKFRKDIYGNKIEKGGNQKISFRDNLIGKPLVETTLIDLKKKVIKDKKKKKKKTQLDSVIKESNDKEKIICSSACNIF